ncbi:ribose-5-phosphate isomerase A [endosymbiont of Euscepes postfasciatus]|uniref:ribose-5-phosphate isomerase A n=1 Tax=endosymbiont of Euscepes postfasciatus TaxID=650377 RepID=UPI000DC6DB56|nr:ribose-5-phosphate isomerase A [endosymbiont of Euscepes postfasciatus]BBA84640.1 ribose-5-phosphate isomerase A [endosymbiont of Euscepes postfasciatus]
MLNINELLLETLKHIKSDIILGIAYDNFTIELIKLIEKKNNIGNKLNCVSSSLNIINKFKDYKINFNKLEDVDYIDLYISSVDEIDNNMNILNGKNGSFTNEKIMLNLSKKFICITDDSKKVQFIGYKSPISIEIINSSIKFIYKKINDINGKCILRNNFISDNGNLIIDIYNLNIENPKFLEIYLNSIPGVIENSIFSNKNPDIIINSSEFGIENKIF